MRGRQANQDFMRMLQQQQQMEQNLIGQASQNRVQGIREGGRAEAQAKMAPYAAIGGLAKAGAGAVDTYTTKKAEKERRAEEQAFRDDQLRLREDQLAIQKTSAEEQAKHNQALMAMQKDQFTRKKAGEDTAGRRSTAANILQNAYAQGVPIDQAMAEIETIKGITLADIEAAQQTASQGATTAGIIQQQAKMQQPGYQEVQQIKGKIKDYGSKLAFLQNQIEQYKGGLKAGGMYETDVSEEARQNIANALRSMPETAGFADSVEGAWYTGDMGTALSRMQQAVDSASSTMLAQIKSGETGLTDQWRQDPELQSALAGIQNIAQKNLQGKEYKLIPAQALANKNAVKNVKGRTVPQNFMQWASMGGGRPPQAGPQPQMDQMRIMNTSTLRGQ